MKKIVYGLYFLLLPVLLSCKKSQQDLCEGQTWINQCEFTIPKLPVADKAPVLYTSFSLGKCVNKMTSFKWKLAVYCASSQVCALGLDLSRKYHTQGPVEFTPMRETCKVAVQSRDLSCEEVKQSMYKSGIIRGSFCGIYPVSKTLILQDLGRNLTGPSCKSLQESSKTSSKTACNILATCSLQLLSLG